MLPELDRSRMHSRVKGKAQLVRRLRGLLIAVARFAHGRATTREDCLWAARTIDGLTVLLEEKGPTDAREAL